jgi:organic hydroperoxide reductase OsmC/OhrA
MIQYPMSFFADSKSASGISTTWSTETSNGQMTAAIPPEFEGPGQGYSPEDYYVLALTNCYIATFKVFAEKSNLNYQDILAKGHLTLDRDEKGIPWMKTFLLKVHLTGCPDEEKALRIMNKVSQSCMVLNSVKTEKKFEMSVSA